MEEVAAPLSSTEDEGGGDEGRSGDDQRGTERHRPPRRKPAEISANAPAGAFPLVHEDGDGHALLAQETRILVAALEADGPAGRRELSRRVRSRCWGPGRFRHAVRNGLNEHSITENHGRLSAASDNGRQGER